MLRRLRVLVLNQTYEPLHICTARRAIRMLVVGKADEVEADGFLVRSERLQLRLPTVIRLRFYARVRRRGEVSFSKRNVFRRDAFTCQYCGRQDVGLTIDHIVPRARGGRTAWANVVAACRRCNAVKGDRLPSEAGLRLLRPPKKPYFLFREQLDAATQRAVREHWEKYLIPAGIRPL
ncbi:MAG: HNH endonuclease [Nitrospinota bacterium]